MDEFRDILDELALIDVKPTNGWFTWSNNREGPNLVKERLDRFLISEDMFFKFTFINTRVVRQSKSDHEVILLNTIGNKSEEESCNHSLRFRYDACWAKEQEARDIIKRIWDGKNSDMLTKMDMVRKELGPWQYRRYKRMKIEINKLEKNIGKVMDGPISVGSSRVLKKSRDQLGQWYDKEEKYWAQRVRNQWLREGDRNTRYFHMQATGRKKKNSIDKLKDMHGTWHEDKKDICHIAWSYFHNLFKTSTDPNEDVDLNFIPGCITDNMNCFLNREFSDEEIMAAFKQMDPRKAPGIDGLSGSFFKEHWAVVGSDVINTCSDILNGKKNVECLNDTLLILIPKIKNPSEMSNFRPISLCRVIYKIISKTLANRLKVVLPSVSPKTRVPLSLVG
ncbi:hypothetical protein V6Z12_D01G177900 [Gossypium hirsutum]